MAKNIPFVFSKVAGHLASLYTARDDLSSAALYAEQALAEGNPLSHYEPRLVRAEVAIARGEPGALGLAAEAVAAAESGGYRASPSRARLERILLDTDNRHDAPVGDSAES